MSLIIPDAPLEPVSVLEENTNKKVISGFKNSKRSPYEKLAN